MDPLKAEIKKKFAGSDFVYINSNEGVYKVRVSDFLRFGKLVDVDSMIGQSEKIATVRTNESGVEFQPSSVAIPLPLDVFISTPLRDTEGNIHGGLVILATGQPLDVPTDLVVSKGTGKLVIVVNAGSDLAGDITITGTSVDRDTGVTTPADTDTITVDALTTDGSSTGGKGGAIAIHDLTGAYISSKWFTGTVTLSTADLTLTDVDVYHCSFEQFNDKPNITLDTFDANIFTLHASAEFDAYLYTIEVTDDKCDISVCADLHVGTDGETALVNKHWRLRRGGLGKELDGTTDGVWVESWYLNTPVYLENVTIKVWAEQETRLTRL